MTQQQPPSEPKQHPLRCETCECGKKRVRILYPNGEEKTRLVKCSKLNQTLTHEEVDVVSLVGCASHSANTGAQTHKQDLEFMYRKGYCDGAKIESTGRNPDGTYSFSTVADWRNRANTAEARIDAVVKELEARLDRSKSQQMNFTSDEGAHADGYESGLESAIALLKEGVGK